MYKNDSENYMVIFTKNNEDAVIDNSNISATISSNNLLRFKLTVDEEACPIVFCRTFRWLFSEEVYDKLNLKGISCVADPNY